MKDSFLTVSGEHSEVTVIEKSRFICYLKHIETEDEAKEFIASVKKKHFDATHNCSAFIADSDGLVARFSDDGEPQGTAGVPMLEALKGKGVFQVVAVVTRYFGGIKLGAGGLVRAYNGCVISALSSAKIVQKCLCNKIEVKTDYDKYKLLLKLFTSDSKIVDTVWDSGVTVTAVIKKTAYEAFLKSASELFSGKPDIRLISDGYEIL